MECVNAETILNLLCDSIHYPDFNNAYEALTQFEQKTLYDDLQNIIDKAEQNGYTDYAKEITEDAHAKGYEEGKKAGVKFTIKQIREKLDGFEQDMGIKESES